MIISPSRFVCKQECECMNVHTCYVFLVSVNVNGSNKLCTGGAHNYGEILTAKVEILHDQL